MRRHPQAVSGVTELMVTELISTGRGMGIDRISMNFAMFRGSFEQGARIGATPVQRFNRRVLLIASRFWQLDSSTSRTRSTCRTGSPVCSATRTRASSRRSSSRSVRPKASCRAPRTSSTAATGPRPRPS
ncbi:phosphatidylglycerol lysyltransferase domain-containing protein [Oerskovia sp. M15]